MNYFFKLNSLLLKKNILTVLFTLHVAFISFAQFDIPPTPEAQTSLYDYASLLNASEKEALEQKLIKYSDSTSTQIVVAIIDSAKGENIGLLAPRWAHAWGVGQSKEDNGVFILLAVNDRKIWITPGYGVESKLTAGIIGELTRTIILPEFKNGQYYSGLNKGIDAIFEILTGTYKNSKKTTPNSNSIPFDLILLFIIILVVIVFIWSKKSGGRGGNSGNSGSGYSILDALILSNMGRSGWGGSSGGLGSSGGGFGGGFSGGFGGGGFSGGGAGGSW